VPLTILSRLGAAWSKAHGCHVIALKDLHHVAGINVGLANLDSYLERTAQTRPIPAALNAKHPDLNACVAISPDGSEVLALRPNFDPPVAASLRAPPLSATWDSDAIAWVTAIPIREAATVRASLAELQTQFTTIAPRGLAFDEVLFEAGAFGGAVPALGALGAIAAWRLHGHLAHSYQQGQISN
jgi:hypothetical protein